MGLSESIGIDGFMGMREDPVRFVRAFDREPFPFQADALRQVLATAGGRMQHRLAVVSWPRQNGKSLLGAWAGLWRLYCHPDTEEIVSVCLDRSSARIVTDYARKIIRGSSVLLEQVEGRLTRSEIRLKDGRVWYIKSSEAALSRGRRPDLIVYDELGHAEGRELYDVLLTAQGARVDPQMLVVSTIGPMKDGVLWDAMQSTDPDTLVLYETRNLSPKITEAFLESQRAKLPAVVYQREHCNEWSEGTDAFCSEEDWKRAIAEGDPRRLESAGPSYCFVDLGWSHDPTAISVVSDGALVALETFQGSHAKPVSFAAVEANLRQLAVDHHIEDLQIESPQAVSLVERLELPGVRVSMLHPTAESNRERWACLYNLLKTGKIRLPAHPRLRRELLSLTIQNTAVGWRVVDVASIHQDHAVSLAGACFLAAKAQGAGMSAETFQAVTTGMQQESRWSEASARDGRTPWVCTRCGSYGFGARCACPRPGYAAQDLVSWIVPGPRSKRPWSGRMRG